MEFIYGLILYFSANITVAWIALGILELRVIKHKISISTVELFFNNLRFPLNRIYKLDSVALTRSHTRTLRHVLTYPSFLTVIFTILWLSVFPAAGLFLISVVTYHSLTTGQFGSLVNDIFWLSLHLLTIVKVVSFGRKLVNMTATEKL